MNHIDNNQTTIKRTNLKSKSHIENAAFTQRSSQRINKHKSELARFPNFTSNVKNQNAFLSEAYGNRRNYGTNQKASDMYRMLQSKRMYYFYDYLYLY